MSSLFARKRQLRAHEHLGRTTIDARRWLALDEEARRELELAENLDRKELTAIERSRNLMRLAEVAAEADRREYVSSGNETLSSGRPEVPGSLRRVADRISVTAPTIVKARQHVAAVDAYPELAVAPQSVAIATAKAVEVLPEAERIVAVREMVAAPSRGKYPSVSAQHEECIGVCRAAHHRSPND